MTVMKTVTTTVTKTLTRIFRSFLEDICLTAMAAVTAMMMTLGWTIPEPESVMEATEVIKKAVGQVEVRIRDDQNHQAVQEEDNRSTLGHLQEQQTLPVLVEAMII
jgi:hypothetical protein